MAEGLQLAAVGISVVFVFLTIMVGLMHGIAWVSRRMEATATPSSAPGALQEKPPEDTDRSARVAAAIAAVHHHRRRSHR